MKAAGSNVEPRSREDSRVSENELLSALPAKSSNRDIRVGAFVIIGVVLFLVALLTLTDVGMFRGRYYATTTVATAGGMRTGDPVQMRGVIIGRVTSFTMVPTGVMVTMEIYNRYEVPEDSRVVIRPGGLLGGVVVDVVPGTSDERIDRYAELPGTVEQDVFTAAGGLSQQAEEVLSRASALLSPATVGGVEGSAVELQALLSDLGAVVNQQRADLAALTQSLRRSAAGVEGAVSGPELEQAVENVQALSVRLDQASLSLESASSSLETVLSRLERGEGTLGRLSADESLYNNLDAAAASVRDLMADIQANPGRYLNVSVF